jgi:hypothetical protein
MLPPYSLVLPAAVELIATGPATMGSDLLPEELFNQSFISSLYESMSHISFPYDLVRIVRFKGKLHNG